MGWETLTFTVFGMRMDAMIGYLDLCTLIVSCARVFICLLFSVSFPIGVLDNLGTLEGSVPGGHSGVKSCTLR